MENERPSFLSLNSEIEECLRWLDVLTPVSPTTSESSIMTTDEPGTGNSGTPTTVIQQVIHHIPLPPFEQNDVKLWLQMVQSRLDAYGVPQKDYFKRIRADMPKQIAQRAPDLMLPTKENDTFEFFEKTIVEIFARKRNEEIAELLDKVTLGDRTPVEVMEYMIKLAGTEIAPSVVSSRFLKLYNEYINTTVKIWGLDESIKDSAGLKKLAEAVQRAYKNPGMISAVANSPKQKENKKVEDKLDEIVERLGKLEAKVANASGNAQGNQKKRQNNQNGKQSQDRGRSKSRGGGNYRNRSQSKPNNQTQKNEEKSGLCYYHRRFGDKATRCTMPCERNGQIATPSQGKNGDSSSTN